MYLINTSDFEEKLYYKISSIGFSYKQELVMPPISYIKLEHMDALGIPSQVIVEQIEKHEGDLYLSKYSSSSYQDLAVSFLEEIT